jgi:hypothetical protein
MRNGEDGKAIMDLATQSESVNRADRQAGADEIEITNAMLEEGLSVFRAYDRRFDLDDEAVSAIYRAMECVRRSSIASGMITAITVTNSGRG